MVIDHGQTLTLRVSHSSGLSHIAHMVAMIKRAKTLREGQRGERTLCGRQNDFHPWAQGYVNLRYHVGKGKIKDT